MIYLTCMGELYTLSRKNYRLYLKTVALDGSADLNDYGKLISKIHNVTDIRRGEAEIILEGGRVSGLPTLNPKA